jgi:hypothetical protein
MKPRRSVAQDGFAARSDLGTPSKAETGFDDWIRGGPSSSFGPADLCFLLSSLRL